MNALVVVESMWGNTRIVAEAVARGLGGGAEVLDVQQAPSELPDDVGLLVVGGPTHAFSMSRDQDAARRSSRRVPGALLKNRGSGSGWSTCHRRTTSRWPRSTRVSPR